ncbi:MAG: hypothetical protein KDB69_01000, partial [Acidimicrobiia bacterium]|nr:hypothetical protein [Acidimicrobiia bacterium]
SASQFTGGVFREVVATLGRSYDLDTAWPVSGPDTERHTRAAVDEGIDAVFAMGGDGVAHHVANGLAGSATALGLIPVGTTNVLSRILGIPQKPTAAAEASVGYDALATRVASISGTAVAGPVNRIATFSVGVGFDAAVVEAAERRPYAKVRFGGVYYATTAIGRLTADWRSRLPNLRVGVDGTTFDAVATLTQVHHPYTYFGRVPLRLTQHAPDGLATLAVADLGIVRGASLLTRAVAGRSQDRAGTRVWESFAEMTVEADPPAPFQADGELLGDAEAITIRPSEDALRVLRPAERPEPDERHGLN